MTGVQTCALPILVENTGKNRIVHVCAMNRKMSLKLGKKFTARKMDDGIRVWRIS